MKMSDPEMVIPRPNMVEESKERHLRPARCDLNSPEPSTEEHFYRPSFTQFGCIVLLPLLWTV